MQGERRSIGQMPYRRRQDGLSALERQEEHDLWANAVAILTLLIAVANNPLHNHILVAGTALVAALIARATAMRTIAWNAHAPIDKVSFFSFLKYE